MLWCIFYAWRPWPTAVDLFVEALAGMHARNQGTVRLYTAPEPQVFSLEVAFIIMHDVRV